MFGVMTGLHDGGGGVGQDKVWLWNEDGKLYVDGGGVQAEVVDDVLASNGVIHIIDRVGLWILNVNGLTFSFPWSKSNIMYYSF